MLEIIVLVYLCRWVASTCREKGYRPVGYVFMTIGLWVIFEFIGAFVGIIVATKTHFGGIWISYVGAIFGALIGGGASALIVSSFKSLEIPVDIENSPLDLQTIKANEEAAIQNDKEKEEMRLGLLENLKNRPDAASINFDLVDQLPYHKLLQFEGFLDKVVTGGRICFHGNIVKLIDPDRWKGLVESGNAERFKVLFFK